jgi:hypothetical protein
MSHPGRHCDEAAGGDHESLGFASDLEGQLAIGQVEGVGVPGVNVGTSDRRSRGAAGVGDRDVLTGDEDADRMLVALKDHPPLRRHQDAGKRPWRSITAAIAAKSGGPPAALSSMNATCRK